MAKPSVSVPDELLDEFDSKINEMKRNEELDMDTNRSEVIREFMRQWTKGNLSLSLNGSDQGSEPVVKVTAD